MSRPARAAGRAILALALGALAAAPVPGAAADPWDALAVAKPTTRVEAPGFTLPDLAGRPVSLEALRGRVVLLYFWATW
jgi:cytochrome oxidase Cu insertion factor (SCO1/SenC/PrrC family)